MSTCYSIETTKQLPFSQQSAPKLSQPLHPCTLAPLPHIEIQFSVKPEFLIQFNNATSYYAIMPFMTVATDKVPPQFITDSNGERIAVILPIELYEQIKPMLDAELDDEGEIRPEVRRRLMQQLQAVEDGERGIPLHEVVTTVGLS
jgi:hypothetical protein